MFFWILFPKIKCREEILLNLKAWSESSFFFFPFLFGGLGWGARHTFIYQVNYNFSFYRVCNYWQSIPLFSSMQSLSCVRLFATPWTAAHQASLFITNSRSLLKLISIELVMPSSHLTFWVMRPRPIFYPSHLLSSSSPPALNLAQHQGLFKWVSSSHQIAKVLEF